MRKFEKARKLKDHIDRIRADYRAKLKDREMAVRQRATAMYLIDRFALRAGNEKSSEEEADTVGCCSLRLEHVLLEPPCTVTFDFLGKDSIRFFNKFEVDEAVFRNLMIFKKQKGPSDMIFDRLSVSRHVITTPFEAHLTRKKMLTINIIPTSCLARRMFPDDLVEQTSLKLHGGPDSQSVQDVQCFNHVRTRA